MAADTPEFRHYRQALVLTYLAVGSLGTVLLISSIVIELFFRPGFRAALPTTSDLLDCNQAVQELLEHLNETATRIQASVTARELPKAEAPSPTDLGDRWADFSHDWQKQWEAINAGCRFDERAGTGLGEGFDRMAYVHQSLPGLRLRYQRMLKQFAEDQAEDIADMRRALAKSRKILEEHAEKPPREGPQ